MAVRKRVGAQLLVVALVGGLISALVNRTIDSGAGVAATRDTDTAALTLPVAPSSSHVLSEPAPAGGPTAVETTAVAFQGSRGEPPSLEQRAAAVIDKMAERMQSSRGNGYVDDLVKSGLSATDSEAIAQRFFAEVGACAFEEARRRYAAQGMDYAQFVEGAEHVWGLAPERAQLSVEAVALRAMPCVADAAQRAGIALPGDLMARHAALAPGLVSTHVPDPPELPPSWARSMESAIRAYIAGFQHVVLTSLEVGCQARSCSIAMVGHDIPVYDFAFDVFAEQNGFDHALVIGGNGGRIVLLER